MRACPRASWSLLCCSRTVAAIARRTSSTAWIGSWRPVPTYPPAPTNATGARPSDAYHKRPLTASASPVDAGPVGLSRCRSRYAILRAHELRESRRVHRVRRPPRREASPGRLREVRADARGALRPGAREGERDARRAPLARARHVSVPRAHAARRRRGAGVARRGGDAAARAPAARRPLRRPEALGEGRRPEPDRIVQGARPRHGDHAV